MTLHHDATEVGVRDLHDRLSEHLERVAGGHDVIVTRRGRPIARISAIDEADPLADLARRGLVTPPRRVRDGRRPRVRSSQPVSDLVAEQQRR
jgi:prevent-host-death family protein